MSEEIFVDENNNKLDIQVLFPFKVEKYDNIYIAYTVGNKDSELLDIYISKIKYLEGKTKVLKIGVEEKEEVLKEYNRIKNEYKLFE